MFISFVTRYKSFSLFIMVFLFDIIDFFVLHHMMPTHPLVELIIFCTTP